MVTAPVGKRRMYLRGLLHGSPLSRRGLHAPALTAHRYLLHVSMAVSPQRDMGRWSGCVRDHLVGVTVVQKAERVVDHVAQLFSGAALFLTRAPATWYQEEVCRA